jgi:hypothetical protein
MILISPGKERAQALFDRLVNDQLTCITIGTVDKEVFHNNFP